MIHQRQVSVLKPCLFFPSFLLFLQIQHKGLNTFDLNLYFCSAFVVSISSSFMMLQQFLKAAQLRRTKFPNKSVISHHHFPSCVLRFGSVVTQLGEEEVLAASLVLLTFGDTGSSKWTVTLRGYTRLLMSSEIVCSAVVLCTLVMNCGI